MRFSKIIALLGVYLPLALNQLAMAQSGTVKAQGQAIPGVTVKATMGERALTTVTDENGAFQFTGMTPGTWVLEADMFGFDHLSKDVPITDTPTAIDLTLQLGARAEAVRPPVPPAQLTQRGGGNRAPAPAPAEQPLEVAPPPIELAQAAPEVSNDAFLVQGTVSNGLQTNNNDFRQDNGFGPNGFPGGPGGDFGPGGPNGQGGPGGPGGGNPGGGGRGNGGGGRGGGGGNFNGGGGGFPGGGGGGGGGRGGGGGGRGGRGGRQQQGLIGNRARQGANQIRINAFDTISDSAFNARTFSTSGQVAAKAPYLSNRYGINIGGPAIIPHLFDLSSKLNFTLNYNGTTATRGIDDVATVPTAAERTGDFSAITNPIYMPGTGTQFANNQLSPTSISPIALALLKYIPLPNQPGTIQNYRFTTSNPNNAQQVSLRLQYTLTAKDRLSVTVQTQHTSSNTTSVLGFLDGTSANGQNETVQWTHNFTPRMFNNLQVGLNRQSTVATNFFENSGVTIPGIAGIAPDPLNDGPPSISFTNFQGINDGYPSDTAVQTGNVQETFTIRRGKHNLQFGGLFNRYDYNQLTDTNSRGSFQFSGAATQLLDANGNAVRNTGYDFADFLLGLPLTDSVRYGASSQYLRGIGYSFFANDDWRLSSRLSLQLGLRYEYTSPFSEKYGHLANLEFAPGFVGPATVVTPDNVTVNGVAYGPNGFPSTLVKPDRNNFAPRIGVAWRAMKKGNMVIRTGWGIYYNEGVYNQIGQRLSQQAPFAMSSGMLQTSIANVLTLANGLTAIPPGNTITDTYAFAPDYRDAYSQNWNFGVQRDMPFNLVVNANYDGIKGTRLNVVIDPNQALPGPVATAVQRQPIPNTSTLSFTEPVGDSILHRGVFQVTRRMRANLSFGLTYTLVKSIDDTGGTVLNPFDIAAERALSSGVSKNTVAFTWTFQSPVDGRKGFLANKGFLTKSLKDWTFQGPIQWRSGTPFTATVQGDVAGIGNATNQRAEATGLPANSGSGYFNTAAFVVPASGTYGDAGRNTIIGPDSFTASLNMSRTFQLKERKSLEIQLNSTNVLNHVNITGFGTTVGAYGYGVATAAGQMRQASFTLRFRM